MTRRSNEAPDDIACVPRWMAKRTDGYLTADSDTLAQLTDAVDFLPEAEAERRDDVVELATYCLVYKRDPLRLFVYRRGTDGHEGRLHGDLSFGVGGGVERRDFQEPNSRGGTTSLIAATSRELREELDTRGERITDAYDDLSIHALLYTDEDSVSADHLAVVSTCEVEDAEVREGRKLREPVGGYWQERGWCGLRFSGFETWSRALRDHLPDLLPVGEQKTTAERVAENLSDQRDKETHPEDAYNSDTPQVEADRDALHEKIRQIRQHTDQRLDALRQQVDALKGRVGDAESDLAALESDTSASAVSACRDQIDDLDIAIEALKTRIDHMEREGCEGGSSDTGTDDAIDEVRGHIQALQDFIERGIENIDDPSWAWKDAREDAERAVLALNRIDTPDASEPEPEPKAEGERVGSPLMQWLADRDHDDAFYLVEERIGYGQQKYGQHLHTDDGRDGLEDLRQELGDAMLYAQKCRMNGRDLDEIRELVGVLAELVGCEGDASEPEGDTIPLESAQAFWTVESESGVRGVRRCYHPHDARLISVMTDRGMLYWPASTPVRVIDKGGE